MIDRWIHGEGVTSGKEFMVRLARPRCIVRIGIYSEFDSDADDWELKEAPSITNEHGEEFCIIAWLDAPADEEEAQRILQEAVVANESYTEEANEKADDIP